MTRHLTLAELRGGLPEILRSPRRWHARRHRDPGGEGRARELDSCELSLVLGVHGDRWAEGCWKTTADGSPHPDVQICITNARCIALIAQAHGDWAPAGGNLFIDLDLTPDNTPPGTRLGIGTAVIEITTPRTTAANRSSRAIGAMPACS